MSQSRNPLSGDSLDRLFRNARTYGEWLPDPVPAEVLRQVYELTRLGPTSANSTPARFVFLTTAESKARLLPALMPSNVEKTRTAPVTTIVAWDSQFYEKMGKLFPQSKLGEMFAANPALRDETAFRNSSLQGGYFILAARALGLDCGPMSGFDAQKVNAEFFPDGKWKANFLCNLGYGDPARLRDRNPRLEFEEACVII
ncbi:MAG TPA: malonic semialdehyde reductase [Candidatus Acidoferrales bacterium]|jgi:3-hydroxypropanoate dehydrogenase|nr:malonic semialdehyde reductase [Candidatus Acidoferrales bacterium]